MSLIRIPNFDAGFSILCHCQSYDTKCKICDKNEIARDEFHYLFKCPVFQKTAIDCSKSITKNFQVCINLLN